MMLLDHDYIDDGHAEIAREIARILEAVSIAMWPGARDLDSVRVPGVKGWQGRMPERLAELHHDFYVPWAEEMHRRKGLDLPFAIDIIAYGVAVNAACRRHRIGFTRGVRLLRESLELYAKIRERKQRAAAI